MTLILGIDPSARKVAMVAYETVTQTFSTHAVNLYGKGETRQTNDSLLRCLTSVRDYAAGLVPTAVGQPLAYVEEPFVGGGVKNPSSTIKQAYVGGIVRACLVEAGYRVYDVGVSSWRGTLGITGRGTAALKATTSALVADRLPKVYHEVRTDHDLVDAAAIVLYGLEQARKGSTIAGLAAGSLQGGGPDLVVRPPRLRRGVRRPTGLS